MPKEDGLIVLGILCALVVALVYVLRDNGPQPTGEDTQLQSSPSPRAAHRYHIVSIPAQSGLYTRYVATDGVTGELVGLHMLSGTRDGISKRVEKLASIPLHPNLVNYRHENTSGDCFVVVMDHANEGTLSEYLAAHDGALNPSEARNLMLGISSGLKHLHDHGCVCRGLHIKGILMSSHRVPPSEGSHPPVPRVRAMLSGYGEIFSVLTQESIMMLPCDTDHNFIAPELLAHKSSSFAPDIWACGAVFCAVLASPLRFSSEEAMHTWARDRAAEPYRSLLLSMLAVTDSDRPTASEVCAFIEKISEI
jgi:serine/threonine protein kinase